MTECKDKTLDLLQVFQNTINTQEDIGIAENLIKKFSLSLQDNDFLPISDICKVENRIDIELYAQNLSSSIYALKKDVLNEDTQEYIAYSVGEILNNICDHSQTSGLTNAWVSDEGFVICAIDNGVGIFHHMKKKFGNVCSESEAIKKAIQRGVTSGGELTYGNGYRNAGYGLFILHSFVTNFHHTQFLLGSNQNVFSFESCNERELFLEKSINGVFACLYMRFESLNQQNYDLMSLINMTHIEDIEANLDWDL